MPTGYTEKLMSEGQSLPDFVMLCARAFGACILMRDDPLDAPIPEKFEPSDYHLKARAEAEAEVKRLEAMSRDEQQAFGEKKKQESIDYYREALAKNIRENQRLDAMRVEVENWQPPSKEYTNFKDFMLNQLDISKNNCRYYQDELDLAAHGIPFVVYAKALAEAKRKVSYHAEEHQKEVERSAGRTKWIQDLRASLAKK